jgi:hypothetical protein
MRRPVLLKITEWQIPVIQLIHKFSENAAVYVGVDGHAEENWVHCAGA